MLSGFFTQQRLDVVDHELIVIDNNSTDRTRDVVREFETHSRLRYDEYRQIHGH